MAGKSGNKLTARQVKNRLDAELVGNVSLRVLNTDRPDTWEVQGRGELQLAVLLDGFAGEGLVAGLVVGLFDGFVLGELLLCVGAGASGIGCELVATELNFGG